jgi:hypothetical protein
MRIPQWSLQALSDAIQNALEKLGLFVITELFEGMLPANWKSDVLPKIKEFAISGTVTTGGDKSTDFEVDMTIDIFGTDVFVNDKFKKLFKQASDFSRFFVHEFAKSFMNKAIAAVKARKSQILCALGRWLSTHNALRSNDLDLLFVKLNNIGLRQLEGDQCIHIGGTITIPVLPIEVTLGLIVTQKQIQASAYIGINIGGLGSFGIHFTLSAPLAVLDPMSTARYHKVAMIEGRLSQSVLDLMNKGLAIFPGVFLSSPPKIIEIKFGLSFAPKNPKDCEPMYGFTIDMCGEGSRAEVAVKGKLGTQTLIAIAGTVVPKVLQCLFGSRRRLTEEQAWLLANSTAARALSGLNDMEYEGEKMMKEPWVHNEAEFQETLRRLEPADGWGGEHSGRRLQQARELPSERSKTEAFARELIDMWETAQAHESRQQDARRILQEAGAPNPGVLSPQQEAMRTLLQDMGGMSAMKGMGGGMGAMGEDMAESLGRRVLQAAAKKTAQEQAPQGPAAQADVQTDGGPAAQADVQSDGGVGSTPGFYGTSSDDLAQAIINQKRDANQFV